MRPLFEQQQQAIAKLQEYRIGALFMEPGTGKTYTAYALIKSANANSVVWFCPKQTIANVKAELAACGELPPVTFFGIESLSNSSRTFIAALEACKKPRTFVVCDESLKIKNWDAIRTKRAIACARHGHWKLVLNGTPLSRNLLDLWAQMEFLSPEILGMSMHRFKRTYCETLQWHQGRAFREQIVGYHNMAHLFGLISPYVYECTLEMDNLTKLYLDVSWYPSKEARDIYEAIKAEWLTYERAEQTGNNLFLQMCQRLQNSYCTDPAKFRALEMVLNRGRKTIVFCKFLQSEQAVREAYPDVTVLTYGKHAFGLNLQDHDQIVFFDKTWDYAQRIQAEGRIWRKGQQHICHMVDLTGDLPLERLINRNIEHKTGLLDLIKQEGIENLAQQL